jgi:hypothetical protein
LSIESIKSRSLAGDGMAARSVSSVKRPLHALRQQRGDRLQLRPRGFRVSRHHARRGVVEAEAVARHELIEQHRVRTLAAGERRRPPLAP